MLSLILQTLLLTAIAFILGAILGCLLRNLFGSANAELPVAAATLGAGVAAAKLAAPTPPPVPTPPIPTAPLRPVEKPRVVTPAAPLVSKPKAKRAPIKRAPAKPKPKVRAKRDNLKLIRGIGPQNEGRLNDLGVSRFAQIAAWKSKDTVHYGDVLAFPGRIEREDWVGQAKVLAKGGATAFAKRVKSGDVGSSLGKATAGDLGKKPKGMMRAARGGKADNLTLIDGVGNAIETKMFKLGIYHFDQVAKMSKSELVWLGNAVGFPGRPERENWAGESKILDAGGTTAHSRKVERGQIKTNRKSTKREK